jgi:anti-sigma factor RsiW
MNQPSLKEHYSEADLLDTYYTEPGASMPVMMHLADCTDCAARYERLEKKMRVLTACAHEEKPSTFWTRQRLSIMRRIGAQQARPSFSGRAGRAAAAATLVIALGGIATWTQRDVPSPTSIAVPSSASSEQPLDVAIDVEATDPWESQELESFQSLVAWESWDAAQNGDRS